MLLVAVKMHLNMIIRMLMIPLGLMLKLYELSAEGARDIHNKMRFRDSIIDRKCCINSISKISRHCHIFENTLILNSTVESCSYIGRNSIVQNASIGSFCSIANDVFIGLGAHPTDHFSTSPSLYKIKNSLRFQMVDQNLDFKEYSPIEIGNDVWIGARSIILDGIKVGDGAIVAAGAIVTKDVPPYAIVGGIPASVIRYRFSPDKIQQLLKIQWWTWPLDVLENRIDELRKL